MGMGGGVKHGKEQEDPGICSALHINAPIRTLHGSRASEKECFVKKGLCKWLVKFEILKCLLES